MTAGRLETVVVATAVEIVVATAWRDLLRAEGIEAELLGPNLQSVYPMMLPFARIDVLVRREDAERARRVAPRRAGIIAVCPTVCGRGHRNRPSDCEVRPWISCR